MFWIGLIVGIAIPVLAWMGLKAYVLKVLDTDWDEYSSGIEVLCTALENRESTLIAVHNDEILDEIIFEEK